MPHPLATLCITAALALPAVAQRGAISGEMLENFRREVPQGASARALQNALVTQGVGALATRNNAAEVGGIFHDTTQNLYGSFGAKRASN